MKAMVLRNSIDLSHHQEPLELADIPTPVLAEDEVLVKVSACGVCHTELDEIEGRTPPPRFPVVPGHQVVGTVEDRGDKTYRFSIGDRVGVAWIYWACGECEFCRNGNENLCRRFVATGRDVDGGYAEYMKVKEAFAYAIPDMFSDTEAAPLLCAGAIGYRSLRLCNLRDGSTLGLTGFGASAHLIVKTVRYLYPTTEIFVFARSDRERRFALELGASWAGDITETPPVELDAIIDTTPAWTPIIEALRNLKPGGRVVINAIRKEHTDKEALLKLEYPCHLWLEKEIKSVANVERNDVAEFLDIAARIPIRPHVEEFELQDANKALIELKQRKIKGAKVLRVA